MPVPPGTPVAHLWRVRSPVRSSTPAARAFVATAPPQAAALAVALAAGCARAPRAPAAGAVALPPCGARGAVAVLRDRARLAAPAAATPGALVARLVAADAGAARPGGPVHLRGPGEPPPLLRLAPDGAGLAATGPLGPGKWLVAAYGPGYQARAITVTVRPGRTDTVHFRLARSCDPTRRR